MKEEGLVAGKNSLQEQKVKSFYRRLCLTLVDEGLHILYNIYNTTRMLLYISGA